MSPGVYIIRNRSTGDTYVGASVNPEARRRTHLQQLRIGAHPFPKLHGCFTPFREEDFEFSVIEECNLDVLGNRELFWISELKPSLNTPKAIGPRPWKKPAAKYGRARSVYSIQVDDELIEKVKAIGLTFPLPETRLSRLIDMAVADFLAANTPKGKGKR